MKTKNLYWIIGIIILGAFLYQYSELFTVSNVTYQKTVSSIEGIDLYRCWNGNTVISIAAVGTKYRIYYTKGCIKKLPNSNISLCEYLSGNKKITSNTIKVFIRSNYYTKSQIKTSYQTKINNILKSMDSPVKDYDYAYYYQSNKDACSNIIGYNCDFNLKIDVEATLRDVPGHGGAEAFFNGEVIVNPNEKSNTIAHEIGHAFGLPDAYYGNFIQLHPEYKNNLMSLKSSLGSKFTQDQKDLIKLYINYIKTKCNNYEESLKIRTGHKDCSKGSDSNCIKTTCEKSGGDWYWWGQCTCTNEVTIWDKGCKVNQKLVELNKPKTDYFNLNSKIDSST